jgi:hypothetical protein
MGVLCITAVRYGFPAQEGERCAIDVVGTARMWIT